MRDDSRVYVDTVEEIHTTGPWPGMMPGIGDKFGTGEYETDDDATIVVIRWGDDAQLGISKTPDSKHRELLPN